MAETAGSAQDLIDRATRGDATARQALLECYRGELREVVASRLDRRLAARVDPSDVVQDTLADASRRLDDYLRDRPIPFFGWLRQLAGERVIDAHRRHLFAGRRSVDREDRIAAPADGSGDLVPRGLLAADTSPSNRLARQERNEQVMAALACLSPRDREVLVLRYLEQRGTAEIAAALSITEGAVKARLLRALIHLRARLEAGS